MERGKAQVVVVVVKVTVVVVTQFEEIGIVVIMVIGTDVEERVLLTAVVETGHVGILTVRSCCPETLTDIALRSLL